MDLLEPHALIEPGRAGDKGRDQPVEHKVNGGDARVRLLDGRTVGPLSVGDDLLKVDGHPVEGVLDAQEVEARDGKEGEDGHGQRLKGPSAAGVR